MSVDRKKVEINDPLSSIASDAEVAAWRKYSQTHVGQPDMLLMTSLGAAEGAMPSITIPTTGSSTEVKQKLNADPVITNLKLRWKQGLTYTAIGHQVLVAVNPYNLEEKRKSRTVELKKQAKQNKTDSRQQQSSNGAGHLDYEDDFCVLSQQERDMLLSDPRGNYAVQEHNQAHIFSFTTRCYWHMLRSKEDQLIVLSGESGSGKSESAKFVIRQLSHLSNTYARQVGKGVLADGTLPPVDSRMAHRLMGALQAIEVFSNAQTRLNRTSSRVHKYVELQFNKHGKLAGAKIADFMLEKNRLVNPLALGKGEKNFQVFYELFQAEFSREEVERFCLLDHPRHYRYLQGTWDNSMKRDPDMPSFRHRLHTVGISRSNQDEVIKMLSAILLLGNLTFAINEAQKQEGPYVSNPETLRRCASLLGVTPEALTTSLTQRATSVGAMMCADILTIKQAEMVREKLAMTLFSMLFEYLILHVNERMNIAAVMPEKYENWIAILDFAGFENQELITGDSHGSGNCLWQLMANFADEKLQEWIHRRIFSLSDEADRILRQDHVSQGLSALIEQSKSQLNGTLQLFVNPSSGLATMLDAETLRQIKAGKEEVKESLVDLYNRAQEAAGSQLGAAIDDQKGSTYYISGQTRRNRAYFGVRHYGGIGPQASSSSRQYHVKVLYDTSDFVSSNAIGGHGKGAQVISEDHLRLIKGTADYPATRNKFLSQMLELKERSMESAIVSTKKQKTSSLERRPTLRNESRRLAQGNLNVTMDRRAALREQFQKRNATVPQEAPPTLEIFETLATPTSVSEFIVDINRMLHILGNEVPVRMWNLYCVKPNDSASSKKFSVERVRSQLRRYDIMLLLAKTVGLYSVSMTFEQFWLRYKRIELPANAPTSTPVPGENPDSFKAKCRPIFQAASIVTGGGMGKVGLTDTHLFLNERSWWALERNLSNIDVTDRVKMKREYAERHGQSQIDANDIWDEEGSLASRNTANVEDTLERNKNESKQAVSNEQVSSQRRTWVILTMLLTWWIPNFLIRVLGGMRRDEVIQAWREKVALNFIILFLSGFMLFLITGYGELMCPKQNVFSIQDLKLEYARGNRLMAIHGIVYDVGNYDHGKRASDMWTFAGQDVTRFFPMWSECFATSQRDNIPNNSTGSCPDIPSRCHVGDGFSSKSIMDRITSGQLPIKQAGTFVWSLQDLSSKSTQTDAYVAIGNDVFELTQIIDLLPPDDKSIVSANLGRRVTDSVLNSVALSCLKKAAFRGTLDTRNSVQCLAAGYSLFAMTAIFMSVMAIKFLAALQLGATRIPEDIDRFCVIQIPCYTENEESLKKTINSCTALNYSDQHKLLFIIADGMIKGSGNDRMTPEIVLDILGVDNASERLKSDTDVPRFDYSALGEGMARLNRAKVFTGFYEYKTHRVPYVVVVKCGKETESRRPGNRGKRDSQLIMMKFLNKVHFQKPLQPLEYEIYRQMTQVLGLDPASFDYCLMVDADTEVVEDSLSRLIAVMLHDSLIMGVCGETRIENEVDSWVTMIQVYEYYISHHLSKAFESLFGSVTCLPGCFCMYRIKSPGKKAIPLLVDDNIIQEYEENQVNTLHKKNLLSLGEDRFLTTLMLKHFPTFRNKFTRDAACKTIVPEKFSVLLSQRRRWINSTVHNLWELLLIPQLCGCLCFSMRLVVALDLLATLTMPASLIYICYLTYLAIRASDFTIVTTSLYLFAAIYGSQIIIFLIRLKWEMIGWMIIYILSMPVYGFALPIYSFWHFDDFSWGNTRVVVGDKGGGHGGGGNEGEVFDEKAIQLKQWESVQDVAKSSKTNNNGASPIPPSGYIADQAALNSYGYPYLMPYPYAYAESAITGASPHPYFQQPTYMPGQFYDPYGGFLEQAGYMDQEAAEKVLSARAPVTPSSAKLDDAPGELNKPNLRIHIINPIPQTAASAQPAVEVLPKEMQDGLYKSLLPLPPSVSLPLAQLIFNHLQRLMSYADLSQLTKRSARHAVQESIRAEARDQFPDEELDLELPERREWINLCIQEVLDEVCSRLSNDQ